MFPRNDFEWTHQQHFGEKKRRRLKTTLSARVCIILFVAVSLLLFAAHQAASS